MFLLSGKAMQHPVGQESLTTDTGERPPWKPAFRRAGLMVPDSAGAYSPGKAMSLSRFFSAASTFL